MMTKRTVYTIILTLIFSFSSIAVANTAKTSGKELVIVASIKPIYNLAAAVLGDINAPILLIGGNNSPHTYNLKPSDIKLINKADILIWGGMNIEPFLAKLIKNNANTEPDVHVNVKAPLIVDITEAKNLTKLSIRTNNIFKIAVPGESDAEDAASHAFCGHSHGSHSHDHGNSHTHTNSHNTGAGSMPAADSADNLSYFDAHVWLSPDNAKAIVQHIGKVISSYYPEHAAEVQNNVHTFITKLDVVKAKINSELKPVANTKYLVFHDAYQYFEKYYKLHNIGVISVNPQISPSAKKLQQINEAIIEQQAKCIFSEPQFNPKLINILHKQTQIRTGEINPLGVDADLGPDGYFKLLEKLTHELVTCLGA
jgi:zinc transport system substrate-binding protein